MKRLSRKERLERKEKINQIAEENIEAREQIESINKLRFEAEGSKLRGIFFSLIAAVMFVASQLHYAAIYDPKLIGYELVKGLKLVEEAPLGVIKAKFIVSSIIFGLSTIGFITSFNDKYNKDLHIRHEEDEVLKLGLTKE